MGRSQTAETSGGLREFLNSPTGKNLAIGGAILMVLVAVFLVWRAMGPGEAEALSRDRAFIDAQTMKGFNHFIAIGETIPIDAPSGGKTGYPAELCYWTKDGKTKKIATAVLLNANVGRPGPTFCPDCGRLVTALNAPPIDGVPDAEQRVPPTQAEYEKKIAARP